MHQQVTVDTPQVTVARHWGRNHLVVDGRVVFTGSVEDCKKIIDVMVPSDGIAWMLPVGRKQQEQ